MNSIFTARHSLTQHTNPTTERVVLVHCRLQKLEEHIVACDAKLVVIDSIASVVRKEYDSTINHNMAERSSFLARVAAILKHTAEAFSIPVCFIFFAWRYYS